jgi:hypothetical protein
VSVNLATGLALLLLGLGSAAGQEPSRGKGPSVEANRAIELAFVSDKTYADPFNDIELWAVFRGPDGKQLRVPAFWAGGQVWKVRYSSPLLGAHRFRTECSDASNGKLHGSTGKVEVVAYHGENPLYRHGPIRVAADRRHFEHLDGTPFFWLGDTWWMGLCRRLHWPEEFQALAADRKQKGFNVVQIVAGLYPDMPAFDPRGANEAGFPWDQAYRSIRPEYFAAADERLQYLADEGFVPCIVGGWGYHLPWLGVQRMQKHWRYLVARYGALPVVWCAAGETTMPYYLANDKGKDARLQKEGWTAVARTIHQVDPFGRLVTLHPAWHVSTRDSVSDPSVVDFELLQTGHGMREVIQPTADQVRAARAALPPVPVIVGEPSYENLNGQIPADICRTLFWVAMTSGAAGHTYGANGIWQVNRQEQPYGPSPGGHNWGTLPWTKAMMLPGSSQVALGKKLLMGYPWWRLEPHPEWARIDGPASKESPFAAGIAGRVRLVYVPGPWPVVVENLEPSVKYHAWRVDPATVDRTSAGVVDGKDSPSWHCPPADTGHDWLLILEAP